MSPQQRSPGKPRGGRTSKAAKPLGPRQVLAVEAARLGEELYAKLSPEGPKSPSVPLADFDEVTGWYGGPPKVETPRLTLKRLHGLK